MNILKEIKYTVSKHYVICLIYGDLSGLNEDEIKPIETMIKEIGTGTIEILDDTEDFRRCEISGYLSDTVDIKVTYFKR